MIVEKVESLIEHPRGFEEMVSKFADNAAILAADYGMRTLGAIVILLVGWFVARQVQRALVRIGHKSPRLDLTITTFLGGLAKYLIIAFTLVAVLSSFGVETTSMVAIMGAAGLAIGLALQGTLSHVAAGFMLVLFRPFRVGDAVETAGVAGTVTEVSLFSTEIRTADNIRVIVPNNAVWSGVTKNLSSYGTRRMDLDIPIPLGTDVAGAIRTVTDIIAADDRIMKNPAPMVGVTRFTDAHARLAVQVWTNTANAGPVQIALATTAVEKLTQAGPFTKK